jgi:hypothetical protein
MLIIEEQRRPPLSHCMHTCRLKGLGTLALHIFILYIFWSSRFSPLYSFLPHPSILYIIIYPLWGPLITLSKYIHVRSSFEEFIKTNLMVQSKFILDFWFVSYNIFKD